MKKIGEIMFGIICYLIPLILTLPFLSLVLNYYANNALFFSFIYLIILLIIIKIYEGFKVGVYRIREIIYSVSLACLINNFITIFIFVVITMDIKLEILLSYFILQIIQIIIILVWAFVGNTIYFQLNERHQIILIYGDDPDEVFGKIISRKNRYEIVEKMSDDEDAEIILEHCAKHESVMLFEVNQLLRNKLTIFCFENNKSLFIVPEIAEIIRRHTENLYIMDTPLLVADSWGLSSLQEAIKRLFDLVIIIPVSIIAIPFLIITAICIKLYDRGPVLYTQKRLTKNGKIFNIYKFRSMKVDAEKYGARLSTKNDDRITPIGKVIRLIRFDELPQLINILRGDMSIVGPRPERPEIAELYCEDFPEFQYRLKTKAGLTGYAQIFGKYNTTPKDKLKLDLMYINQYSIFLDIKICLYTIKILFISESTEGIQEGTINAKH